MFIKGRCPYLFSLPAPIRFRTCFVTLLNIFETSSTDLYHLSIETKHYSNYGTIIGICSEFVKDNLYI